MIPTPFRLATLVLAATLSAGPVLAQESADPGTDYITSELALPPEDVEAVRQVILRLNHAIDVADYALYGSFFAPEAEFVSGFGTTTGPDGIAEAMEQSSAFTMGKRHVSANLVISGEGDRAVVTSYQVVFEREEGLRYTGSAVNVDTLEKRDGEWLIVRHDSTLDPATQAAVQEMMGGSGN